MSCNTELHSFRRGTEVVETQNDERKRMKCLVIDRMYALSVHEFPKYTHFALCLDPVSNISISLCLLSSIYDRLYQCDFREICMKTNNTLFE